MLECWKEKPMLRPSFDECAERLGQMLGQNVKEVDNCKFLIIYNIVKIQFNKGALFENNILSTIMFAEAVTATISYFSKLNNNRTSNC